MAAVIRRFIPLGPEATAWQIHGGFHRLDMIGSQYFAIRQPSAQGDSCIQTHCYDDPERIPLMIAAGRLQEQP
jgi:hypothetical protein